MLRRVQNEPMPEEDVEAPKDKNSPTKTSTASADASSSESSSARTGHDPVFLAKVIFRKVVELLASEDEDGDEEPSSIISTLVSTLRDVVMGITVGVVMISLLVFLDHRDIIHVESAHNLRAGAFQMVNNPETLATIEESSGLKLLPTDKYESMLNEIEKLENQKPDIEKKLQAKSDELEAKEKEMSAIRAEHTELWNHPLVGLNKWCGGCSWSGKINCDGRVAFLQRTYQSSTVGAKVSAMTHPSCKSA